MSLRMEKIDKEIRKQISDIIKKEIDDPLVEFLSVTRVRTTKDLQESRIYFSLLDESQVPEAKDVLSKMSGRIRSLLGKRIRLRITPKLIFFPDESIKYSVDIYQKIEEIKLEDAGKDTEEDNR